ncbi:hypothetical protein PRIPAC_78471 [Pristionchus pacificus]|uniref:G protein-coupled receptor n=1 Tax=Pristionchus pacificus TaxID=54126 RepID=A0A2A6CKJ4_PRIPA|nr:hypothetical protein PRIPAC_78471 [Pristionchus pacificus]|eukprot:PDM78608.1 G protein-coupled receptor [Pristionchus pacificus]
MGVAYGTGLQFGLEWDRDLLMRLCEIIRHVFWPVSVFLIHPLVLFVLIRKTKMDLDCKITFVIHDVVLVLFDVFNGYFYQFYTLLPYPIFFCTGVLCDADTPHRLLLTILAFLTISMCVPYLFVMMRMHQKIVSPESRAKLSKRSQLVLMCFFTTLLVSNALGFAVWAADSPDRDEILNIPDIAWTKNVTSNFLVPRRKSSKAFAIQLRFMISMAIQACLTTLFFIAPLFALGITMATPIAHFVPAMTLPFFRIVFVKVRAYKSPKLSVTNRVSIGLSVRKATSN